MTKPLFDFSVLAEEEKEELVESGINFMSSITEIAGPEVGIQLWDQINKVLGDDLKGQIFFKLLTGHDRRSVRLLKLDGTYIDKAGRRTHDQAVPIIKCIRTHTGVGLKEAKDFYDAVVAPSR